MRTCHNMEAPTRTATTGRLSISAIATVAQSAIMERHQPSGSGQGRATSHRGSIGGVRLAKSSQALACAWHANPGNTQMRWERQNALLVKAGNLPTLRDRRHAHSAVRESFLITVFLSLCKMYNSGGEKEMKKGNSFKLHRSRLKKTSVYIYDDRANQPRKACTITPLLFLVTA